MKLPFRKSFGFTIIELLVCIVVIGVLIVMSLPRASVELVQGQKTGTLSNARQLHLATQTMALDTFSAGGNGMDWTMQASRGRTTAVPLATYFDALTKNNYLTKSDLDKLLTAPGIGPKGSEPTARNICFKIFQVDGPSPSDQPLFVTANWQSTGLTRDDPYGKTGFVVFAKGGSGGIYKRPSDVTNPNIFPTGSKDGHPYSYLTLE
jgi:prepilin-type N-terminal cleavage/methylation domain-containing protein